MQPFSRRALAILLLLSILPGLALAGAVIQADAPPPYFGGEPLLEIFFLPIGEGDAFFLRSGGETMLIDGGRTSTVQRLRDFFADQGVTGVTALLNTHWHDDHITAMITLLREGFWAQRFYTPYPVTFRNEYYDKLRPLLAKGEISYETVTHGDVILFGHVRLLAYRDLQPHGTNAQSLILQAVAGERTLLLMADAGGLGEHELMRTVGESIRSDVLKVSHHGAQCSVKGFLDMVKPEAAIVTSYQRAVPATDNQLKAKGIARYFTSSRMVYLVTDGNVWYIYQE